MWSTGSGGFGNKLKGTGINEVIFKNCSATPVYAVFLDCESRPSVELKPAGHLLRLTGHDKIMFLHKEYSEGSRSRRRGKQSSRSIWAPGKSAIVKAVIMLTAWCGMDQVWRKDGTR